MGIRAFLAIAGFLGITFSYMACGWAVCPAPITVSGGDNNPASATQYLGDEDRTLVMMQMKLENNFEEVGISEITIVGSGTANELTDVAEVRLYHDANGDGQLDDGDLLLGTGAFVENDGSVDLAASPNTALMTGGASPTVANALVVYVIRSSTVSGKTFQAIFPNNSDITSSGGACGIGDFTGAPVTGGVLTTAYGGVSATVGAFNSTDGYVYGGDENVPMLQLTVIGGSNEDLGLDSITITDEGAAEKAHYITAVRLWLDSDNSGTVTPGDTQLNADQHFVGGVPTLALTMGDDAVISEGGTVNLLVTYSFAGGAVASLKSTIGSFAWRVARTILQAPFALAGCGGESTEKMLENAPEGFVFTDQYGNEITEAVPGTVVQVRDAAGLPILQFTMGNLSVSLDGAALGRDSVGTLIALAAGSGDVTLSLAGASKEVSGLPQDLIAFVPCGGSDNGVVVCPDQTVAPASLDCSGFSLLRAVSPTSDRHIWTNPDRVGAEDCTVSGSRYAFNAFYGAGVFSSTFQTRIADSVDLSLSGAISDRSIAPPSLSTTGGLKTLIHLGD